MYDNRFGMYPSDDMNDNINSYFGESDTNFFADNSNGQMFGEGFAFDSTGFSFNNIFCESDDDYEGLDEDIIAELRKQDEEEKRKFGDPMENLRKQDEDFKREHAERMRKMQQDMTQQGHAIGRAVFGQKTYDDVLNKRNDGKKD